MWRMEEPKHARTEQSLGTVFNHVRSAAKNILHKRWIVVIFLALAFITAGRFVWYEYYQLYALNQNVAPVLFGVMLALIHIGNILGSEFAHRIKNPNRVMLTAIAILVLTSLGLAFVSTSFMIIALLTICFFGSQAGTIILDENLQHETDSELRATTLSLAGLVSRIIFGIAAVIIILYQVTPQAISIAALATFLCVFIYFPVRKRLVEA